MKKNLLLIILLAISFGAKSQTIEKIFFNLYTDSLKKGMYNYINVDAKLSNGKYLPLTSNELKFTTSYGEFKNNELLIPFEYKVDSVTITIALISNPSITKTKVIYIKKLEDPDLPEPTASKNSKTETPNPKKNKRKKKLVD